MSDQVTGWLGEIELVFQNRNGRTVLERNLHKGPLQVQKPFYPEGDAISHVYLLHPPGGVVGGDVLKVTVAVTSNAHALITTPAAAKFYRSEGSWAHLNQRIAVSPDAVMEWFPQGTIIFSGAKVKINTHIDLSQGSRFIGWDLVCLGRPACGESFQTGCLDQRIEIWQNGTPLRIERLLISGGGAVLSQDWGLQGFPVIAQLICANPEKGIEEKVRDLWKENSTEQLFAVSRVNEVLIIRILGHQLEAAKNILIACWDVLRQSQLGRHCSIPRIGNT